MLYNHFTKELLGLQGVKITNVEQEENLIIHLEPERKSQNSSFIQRRSRLKPPFFGVLLKQ